ncbi:flagellar biosynthesis protein FlhF [bacterium SCSIO 12696]|nr:flagellar biosynthesis protein FlhF [bacterium SCSIO 12696]
MKIQRFIAKDSRQAMREVREAMGGDAVILSSQRVAAGIEVVAAADYDEKLLQARIQDGSLSDVLPSATKTQQAPGARDGDSFNEMRRELTQLRDLVENGLAKQKVAPQQPAEKSTPAPPAPAVAARAEVADKNVSTKASTSVSNGVANGGLRTLLLQRLMNLGLGRELSMQLADAVPLVGDLADCWNTAMKRLSAQLQEGGNQILSNGGCAALVGPTGVGKTTSVAKLAARFAMRHGRQQVALITTDCYRIGGQEQIYTFGRILGVPVRLATNRDELTKAIGEFADRRLVLIDTAGMSQRDMELMKQFDTLQGAAPDMQIYLTLSATSQLPILDEVVRKFGVSNLAGAIVTKVDESASLGPVLSTLIRQRLPVAYLGNGQRVPEDIQLARAAGMVKDAQQMMEAYGLDAAEWQQPFNQGFNDVMGGQAVNAGVA